VKLTIHLHLMLLSKNAWSCASTTPIRLHDMCSVYKKSTGTTLPLPFTNVLYNRTVGTLYRMMKQYFPFNLLHASETFEVIQFEHYVNFE
jgi:hypothetical protein